MGCVDEVDFDVNVPPLNALPVIIDATITSGWPATAVLSKAYPADGEYYYTPITGAAVWVTDLDDPLVSVDLLFSNEKDNGTLYQSMDTLNLEVGHRYQLHVSLGSRVFESTPQQVSEPGVVDSVYFEFVEGYNPATDREEDGFNVYMDSSMPSLGENYVRWEMNGTHLLRTIPPETCGDCFSICWVSDKEDLPLISRSRHTSGSKLLRTFVKYIPINYTTFNDRYHVEVVQHIISRDAWEFYDALRYQLENTASLFQPAFSALKGNINAVGPQAPVIGIFTATQSARKSLFIKATDIPYKVRGVTPGGDCRSFPNSTGEMPPFWKN
jgi:hypothetical protein